MEALVGTDISIDIEIEKVEDIENSEVEGYYEAIMDIYINHALATAKQNLQMSWILANMIPSTCQGVLKMESFC